MRYRILTAPPRGNPHGPMDGATAAALMPIGAGASPKALKWGFWGNAQQLCGQPGTQPIPVHPFPSERIDTYRYGHGPGSGNAPNHFRPALYYVHGKQEHAPVSLQRTNNMPVPAVDPYDLAPGKPTSPSNQSGGTQTTRLAQIAFRSWHIGGRKATGWPVANQRFGTH